MQKKKSYSLFVFKQTISSLSLAQQNLTSNSSDLLALIYH